ncbi:uncharacterized protein PHACADRAFT_265294, partial [Phanerochaete carnosa HHB-10118-sp]
CRNGDPNCGNGYICTVCYNCAVQPMGYPGVNPCPPQRPQPQTYCYPVYYCQPRRC